jgi:hypothetical protein
LERIDVEGEQGDVVVLHTKDSRTMRLTFTCDWVELDKQVRMQFLLILLLLTNRVFLFAAENISHPNKLIKQHLLKSVICAGAYATVPRLPRGPHAHIRRQTPN